VKETVHYHKIKYKAFFKVYIRTERLDLSRGHLTKETLLRSQGGQVSYAPDFHPGSQDLTTIRGSLPKIKCLKNDHKLQGIF